MGPFGFPGMRMAPEGGKGEALKEYSVDLTEMAKEGKLDPVIGRDEGDYIRVTFNRCPLY